MSVLSPRQLLGGVVAVLAIAACERTITGPVVYVDRPFPRTDTLIVTRPETTIVVRPETSFVQLPRGVDTVVVVRPDTVIRIDTLRIITHDTVVVHDTVRHVDTIVVHDTVTLDRTPASVCLYMLSATRDTMFMYRPAAIGPCAPGVMAPLVPTVIAVVLFDTLKMQLPPPPIASRASSRPMLILPSWRATP